MSDEWKVPRRRWMSRTLAALVLLASYETTHYATVEHVSEHYSNHVCRDYDQHAIGYEPVAPWVECLFGLATWIDDLEVTIRNNPWHQR